MAVDSAIVELMNESVTWEKATAKNRYAEAGHSAGVAIRCFIEPEGFGSGGGIKAARRPDETVTDALFDIYFDASDANVQLFSMDDYFTVAGESAEAIRTQPERITNFYGPKGEAWLKVVTL